MKAIKRCGFPFSNWGIPMAVGFRASEALISPNNEHCHCWKSRRLTRSTHLGPQHNGMKSFTDEVAYGIKYGMARTLFKAISLNGRREDIVLIKFNCNLIPTTSKPYHKLLLMALHTCDRILNTSNMSNSKILPILYSKKSKI